MITIEKIVNVETGEETVIEREMTAGELEAFNKAKKEAELIQEAQAEAQAKRVAALAKLEVLGLDENDLKALGL